MKWINSTAGAAARGLNCRPGITVFHRIDTNSNDSITGTIRVDVEGTVSWWAGGDSTGPADSVGQAKMAVERLGK